MNSLERISNEFDALMIRKDTKKQIMPYLKDLESYHRPTFEHSLRVAYLGKSIAEFTHITEPKSLWLPGLVHDLGKIFIEKELLDKKIGWNKKDFELMKRHVEFGCVLLLGSANFSSLTTFYSHYFKKKNSYPSDKDFKRIFEKTFDHWSEASITKGKYCGRLVALADIYDSATTREDDKFSPGIVKRLSLSQIKKFLLEENSDQKYLIRQLYKAGIFREL